jgi:isopenicillin N synthase-like dioxygenase
MSTESPASQVDRIPVIDFSPYMEGSETGKTLVSSQIRDAAERIGFFYISNPPVKQETRDAAFEATRSFFSMPLEEKLKIKINSSHRGYLPIGNSSYDAKLKPNVNESFLVGLDLPADDPDVMAQTPLHGPNQWLPSMMLHKHAYETYFNEMRTFGEHLLKAAAKALQLDESFFVNAYTKPMPFIRAVHYPSQAVDRAENEFGSATHTDNGCLTLLSQDDIGGLQVQRRDGGWIDAPPIANTYVINIGDMLMRWTNDKWVSTPHRVINVSGKDRYSIPFFYNPSYHTQVACIPSCLDASGTAKYEPVTWGEYFTAKFNRTYAYRKQAA